MFVAWWHQSITWTYADWSSLRSFGIHLGISHEMLKISILGVSLKITDLGWQPHLTEANDLKFHQFLQGISKVPIAYEIQEWVDGGVDIGQPVRGFI